MIDCYAKKKDCSTLCFKTTLYKILYIYCMYYVLHKKPHLDELLQYVLQLLEPYRKEPVLEPEPQRNTYLN